MAENPLNSEQIEHLREEIIKEAKRTLVGRRMIGIYGPLGGGIDTVGVERYGPDEDAEINFQSGTDPKPVRGSDVTVLRIPILYKDFILHWRDVAFSKKVGAPIDASRAIRAAHAVADREDRLIFNGDARLGLEGLLNANGRARIERSDWSKYGNAYRDVVRATEVLLMSNHHRPFALAVSAQDHARLLQQREGQFAPEIDAIARLCEDGVFSSPTIPEGKAVLISTGDQNFDIAISEDLSITFLGERDQDYHYRVYEGVVLRIKRASAICTIENEQITKACS
ncbi:MAG: family 1 encapsulin nanocompartment shell protein [Sandaracinaceae bacterium]|nr:family 1 encapsulin nanocompartment shell protein [Sandaracinaceae bacterium]